MKLQTRQEKTVFDVTGEFQVSQHPLGFYTVTFSESDMEELYELLKERFEEPIYIASEEELERLKEELRTKHKDKN